MKGIVLAGGTGSRLYPLTIGVSKQLLPIYDKPMIFYPISVLMNAGINEILIISTSYDINSYQRIFGDGSRLGLRIEYKVQDRPEGIAQAFIIAEDFIDNENVCLILGDNLFYGVDFQKIINSILDNFVISTIVGCYVENPCNYGVIEFDLNDNPIKIIEKPNNPPSNYAVTGLYFYDKKVINYAKKIKPSNRGELEITDINNLYLKDKELKTVLLDAKFIWLDTGTVESLTLASKYIENYELSNRHKIACLEEIAYKKNWISIDLLRKNAALYKNSPYGNYISSILNEIS